MMNINKHRVGVLLEQFSHVFPVGYVWCQQASPPLTALFEGKLESRSHCVSVSIKTAKPPVVIELNCAALSDSDPGSKRFFLRNRVATFATEVAAKAKAAEHGVKLWRLSCFAPLLLRTQPQSLKTQKPAQIYGAEPEG